MPEAIDPSPKQMRDATAGEPEAASCYLLRRRHDCVLLYLTGLFFVFPCMRMASCSYLCPHLNPEFPTSRHVDGYSMVMLVQAEAFAEVMVSHSQGLAAETLRCRATEHLPVCTASRDVPSAVLGVMRDGGFLTSLIGGRLVRRLGSGVERSKAVAFGCLGAVYTTHIHVNMHMHIHIHIHVCIYVYKYTCKHPFTCTHTYMYTCIYMHIHIHIDVQMQSYTYT